MDNVTPNVKCISGKHIKVVDSGTCKENLILEKIITKQDAEMDARASEAVKAAVEKAKFCKKPVARYDTVSKRTYIEYADGEKKYVD